MGPAGTEGSLAGWVLGYVTAVLELRRGTVVGSQVGLALTGDTVESRRSEADHRVYRSAMGHKLEVEAHHSRHRAARQAEHIAVRTEPLKFQEGTRSHGGL